MKKIYNLIIMCLLFITFIIPQKAYAENFKTYDVVSVSDNSYTIKCSVMNGSTMDLNDICYAGQPLKNYLITATVKCKDDVTAGNFTWENPEYIISKGEQTVKLLYQDYISNKTITCEVYLYGLEQPKKVTDDPYDDTIGTPKSEESIEDTTTALTVSNLILADEATYDINLVNRDLDSSYSWTTSNSKVATVNKAGVVSPIAEGDAIISCIETKSNGAKNKLTTTVIIGESEDNNVILSDDDINIDLGDTYKLTAENKEIGSTVKFKSLNKEIAKVSTSGKITALNKGKTNIIVTITSRTNVIVLSCSVLVE